MTTAMTGIADVPAPTAESAEWLVRYRPLAGVVAEPLGKDLVVLDLARGTAFRLNATGRQIYDWALQQRTPAEMVGELAAGHGIDRDRARGDVSGLLFQLVQARLLAPLEDAPRETPG